MVTVADTAFVVAIVRAEEAANPSAERLFEDPYAALFAAGGAHAAEATARFLALPFVREGIRIRTKQIDDFVREGLAAGVSQVVLFGAGFDTRALRMAEITACGAVTFEVDFAEQLERKRALLAAGEVVVPARVRYVPCDFMATDFEASLAMAFTASGFERGAGAVFVCEGVVSYIDLDAIDRSLRFMADIGGPKSRLIFDFADALFEPGTAADHVRRSGFTTFDAIGYDALWRRWMPSEPHEHAAMCKMGMATV